MSYDYKHYDAWRNSLVCSQCDNQHYRKGLCRDHYKEAQTKTFHCTHKNCISPVFSHTLCQRHYRSYRQRCLICGGRHVYYRHLCRSHYRKCCKTGYFPVEPKCKECDKHVFADGFCLKHFKKKYSDCLMPNCKGKSFRRGLCCSHYFKQRRQNEKKESNT